MPQRRWRNRAPQIILSGAIHQAELDDTEQLILWTYNQLFRNPAKARILEYLHHLRDLGFDLRESGMVERAISAGQHAHAGDLSYRERVTEAAARDPRRHDPIVYYMRMGDLVKIGTTANIHQRHMDISPQEILAVEFGDERLERMRQREFADSYSHGEWFHLTERLTAHAAMLAEHFQRSTGATVDAWLAERLPQRRLRFSSASTPGRSPVGHADSASSPSDASASAARPSRSGPSRRSPKRPVEPVLDDRSTAW